MTVGHTVTVDVEDYGQGVGGPYVTVRFTCTAPTDAPCRTHPAAGVCDCDGWWECDDPDLHAERGHTSTGKHDSGDHPFVPGQECWVTGWFDNDGANYVGDDAEDDIDGSRPPAIARSGEISVDYCEDYIEWSFVHTPPPPAQSLWDAHASTP